MSWVAAAVGGAALVGGIGSAVIGSNAAGRASSAQERAAQLGVDEQRRQFDQLQTLLSPYAQAGTGAIQGYGDLLGSNGNTAQQSAIDAIKGSAAYTSARDTGTNAILANASATGGLRGGNVQASLGKFEPALLSSLINQKMQGYGGLISIGQNAAAGVGNAGLSTGRSISDLYGQAGAAQAGGYLADGRAAIGGINAIGSGLGAYYGAQNRAPVNSGTTIPQLYGSSAANVPEIF